MKIKLFSLIFFLLVSVGCIAQTSKFDFKVEIQKKTDNVFRVKKIDSIQYTHRKTTAIYCCIMKSALRYDLADYLKKNGKSYHNNVKSIRSDIALYTDKAHNPRYVGSKFIDDMIYFRLFHDVSLKSVFGESDRYWVECDVLTMTLFGDGGQEDIHFITSLKRLGKVD